MRKRILAASISMVVLIAGCNVKNNLTNEAERNYQLDNSTSLELGDTVPELIGLDTAGKAISLSDYRGKVVLLVFWGHW